MKQRALNRRQFLTTTSAGLLGPLTLGCTTPLLRPRRELPITVGIVGMGIRARNLMRSFFLKDERVRVLAVCDVDTTRREHYQKEVHEAYGNEECAAYVDYREILDRRDIDAVVITTPDHWHITQAVDAARAGKDIYCEKPLTHTLAEGRLIMDAVQRHRVVFQTGSQQRSAYQHKFVKAVEYVRNGRIGKLLSVHVGVGDPPKACDLAGEEMEPGLDWDRWLGPAPERAYHSELSPRGVHGHYPRWRAYWDYCGGYLADMGAHHFDIAQWGLDADQSGPIEVAPPRDGHPGRGATLYYENGVSVVHGGPSGATFIGTTGMIQVDRGRISSVPGDLFDTPIGDDELQLPRNISHPDDWVRCIQSRETPICSAEIGARSAAVCQLLNLAYRYQQRIAWDPQAWSFADDSIPTDWMDYERRSSFALPQA